MREGKEPLGGIAEAGGRGAVATKSFSSRLTGLSALVLYQMPQAAVVEGRTLGREALVAEGVGEAGGRRHPGLEELLAGDLADEVAREHEEVGLDEGAHLGEAQDLGGARVLV